MDFIPVAGKTSCIDMGYPLVGLYELPGHGAVMIDSGVTDSPEIVDDLNARGLTLRAILLTHIHPDHIANNFRLHQAFGCPIYAHPWEIENARVTHHPPMAPEGETPPPILPFAPGQTEIDIDGALFTLKPIPGHTQGQLAVTTPDRVCFLGDAILAGEILAGAKLPFLVDVDKSIETMEALLDFDEPWFVPAHKAVVPKADMPEVVRQNIDKELHIYDVMRKRLTRPTPAEELLTEFMRDLGLGPNRPRRFPRRPTFTLAEQRLTALQKAGECTVKDGVVYPA